MVVAHNQEQLQILVENCGQFRGSKAPRGYPDSLALCIIDSIQSTGVRYSSVRKVVDSYGQYRRTQDADPTTDGARELIATFDELGGPEVWAQQIGNRNKTSTKAGAPLKAEAIRDAAKALTDVDVTTTAELRDAASSESALSRVESAWCGVVAQRSGVTWHYVQMLAGTPGVKPDRMIIRFVADSLALPRSSVTPKFALDIVKAAAESMSMSPSDLDHGIWQYQRRRR
ncbi:heme peroxidase [Mycolicibacterium poriferae]|uniref:Heme peroxidase n=1 Tax=Mycolicibacterium poriferae TaxID=39694 RepID=A0A6N4V8E1_9MYCO|nr:hypothetical protein [Mycolicibacterium poriferae]BBX50353.1 heme peroxidase [Mycolicibacterium poriferae]